MPKSSLQVAHGLTRDEARSRIQQLLPLLRDQYAGQINNLQESWAENVLKFRFSTFGQEIRGEVTVGDDQIDFNTELPLAASVFRGKIESSVREKLSALLAPDGAA